MPHVNSRQRQALLDKALQLTVKVRRRGEIHTFSLIKKHDSSLSGLINKTHFLNAMCNAIEQLEQISPDTERAHIDPNHERHIYHSVDIIVIREGIFRDYKIFLHLHPQEPFDTRPHSDAFIAEGGQKRVELAVGYSFHNEELQFFVGAYQRHKRYKYRLMREAYRRLEEIRGIFLAPPRLSYYYDFKMLKSGRAEVESCQFTPYSSMGTVWDFITTTPNIGLEVRYRLIVSMLMGVSELKLHGIEHGDLSPYNLLVFGNKNYYVGIIDFDSCSLFRLPSPAATVVPPELIDNPNTDARNYYTKNRAFFRYAAQKKHLVPSDVNINEIPLGKADAWAAGIVCFLIRYGCLPEPREASHQPRIDRKPYLTGLLTPDPFQRMSVLRALVLCCQSLQTQNLSGLYLSVLCEALESILDYGKIRLIPTLITELNRNERRPLLRAKHQAILAANSYVNQLNLSYPLLRVLNGRFFFLLLTILNVLLMRKV